MLADIAVGDVLELLDTETALLRPAGRRSGVLPGPPRARDASASRRRPVAASCAAAASAPPSSWSTATGSTAAPSATCSWTTCANASPPWTTPACAAWPTSWAAVLDGPGTPPSRHRLACTCRPRSPTRGSSGCAPCQDDPRTAAGGKTARPSAADRLPRMPDPGPGVLPRPGPVGAGGPRPLGAVGRALPGRRAKRSTGERTSATASPAWTPAPANGCRCCRCWSRTVERRRARHRRLLTRPAQPGRDNLHRQPARTLPASTRPSAAARSGLRRPGTGHRRDWSTARKSTRSGPGRSSKCCARPASASRN